MHTQQLLHLVNDMSRNLEGDHALEVLAKRTTQSPFRLLRHFQKLVGETPKHFILRLRLERAAGDLLSTTDSVLNIALNNGFNSHEVFVRAFRRHFGCRPKHYRKTRFVMSSNEKRQRHLRTVRTAGPCIGLYRIGLQQNEANSKKTGRKTTMPITSIEREILEPQPILYIRRKIVESELQATMGECFGKVFRYAQTHGIAMAGNPLARFTETTIGLRTVDFGLPLVEPAEGHEEIEADFLASGPVAKAVHMGPYEQLGESNAAVHRWIEDNGYQVAGAPWNWYVTSPAEDTDPSTWRTEVYWPITDPGS